MSNYISMIWLMLTYVHMIGARILLPDPLSSYVGSLGIAWLFIGIFGQELAARLKTYELTLLKMVVFPVARMYHVYYKSFDPYQIGPSRYFTVVHLGILLKHHIYGKVDTLYFYHNVPWEQCFKFQRGLGMLLGIIFFHGQTDYCLVSENSEFVKPVFIDNAKPYPTYDLIVGGGDYAAANRRLRTAAEAEYNVARMKPVAEKEIVVST